MTDHDFGDQTSMDRVLSPALERRHADSLYRSRRQLETPQGCCVVVDGKRYLNFSSNDYLGMAAHPELIEAFKTAANDVGVGSGASHLVNGHHRYHHQLEDALAEFTGRDRALLFSTGYMANMGTINALVGRGDLVLQDRLNHASLLDGGLLSGAKFQRFQHGDCGHLKRQLDASNADRKLVVVDGIFSMDGDCAPLVDLSHTCQNKSAWLMVDDAHGLGVMGNSGAGVTEHFGLSQAQAPILMATLGKAVGTFGAFVAGSNTLIESLIQFARPYIYTTAMPPAVAAASIKSLQLIQRESWRRENLHQLIDYFVSCADGQGIELMPSRSAIQPVVIGDDQKTLSVARKLQERGFLVGAIRPPTVPAGSARLRITLSADHKKEDIDQLIETLSNVLLAEELTNE